MENWYIVTTQDNSADQLLHMFWEFHDFRIVDVVYSAAEDRVHVLFEYDDRRLRILLRFEGNVRFFVAHIDFEVDWISCASLRIRDGHLQWINGELDEDEHADAQAGLTFFQGDRIIWALVDENGESLPIAEELLHQHLQVYHYQTRQWEEKVIDYTVTPLQNNR